MDRQSLIATIVAVLCMIGGVQLIGSGDVLSISAGILILVGGLGSMAVAVGGRPYGPLPEGNLDLSTRIAMGLLGGVLAGLAHGVLSWLVAPIIVTALEPGGWQMRFVVGGLWGLIFGVMYPGIPGRDFARKGIAFSVLPTLLTLLYIYPVQLGGGLLGFRLGPLQWAVVAAGNAVAGVVAAAIIDWADRTDLAPVSRPLVE